MQGLCPLTWHRFTMKKLKKRKPVMKQNQTKTKEFHVRVTPEDYEKLLAAKEESGCATLSEYVMWACVRNGKVKSFPPRKELRELRAELVKEGTNLNQIAKAANKISENLSHKREDNSSQDILEVLAKVSWLKLTLISVWDRLDNMICECGYGHH
jgi:hypothetical protein